MDIWVKDIYGRLINLKNATNIFVTVLEYTSCITIYFDKGRDNVIGKYATEQRCKEVIQLIQDHINAIGTNNFNNLPMVYVMPLE